MSVREMEGAVVECPECESLMVWDLNPSYRTHPFKSFITTHVDGKPLEINSLHELRTIERIHKVNFPAFSGSMMNCIENYNNWTSPDGKTHRG